jgi:DNA repair protein RadC
MTKRAYDKVPVYSLQVVKERTLKYPADKVPHHMAAAAVFQAYLEDKACEHLAILLLDGQSKMIGIATITIGGLDRLSCSVRSVFEHVIGGRAHGFILGHNHPSGNVQPSPEDLVFTQRVMEASEIIGVPMLDHIIISSSTNRDSLSFLDKGLL